VLRSSKGTSTRSTVKAIRAAASRARPTVLPIRATPPPVPGSARERAAFFTRPMDAVALLGGVLRVLRRIGR